MLEFRINAGAVFEKLLAAQQKGPKVLAAHLYRLANTIMTDSKRNYCPKSPPGSGGFSGQLRASGTVDRPVVDADGSVMVRMYFGGPAAAYALAVHEHLSEYSPPSWKKAEESGHGINWTQPGTGPKYLERPLLKHSGELPVAAAKALPACFSDAPDLPVEEASE